MLKPIHAALIVLLGATLAACGGSTSATPSGNISASVNTGSGAAKASASTGVTSSQVASAAGAAASAVNATVAGQKAPGPYTPDGTADATSGAAKVTASDSLKWQPNTITVKAGSKVTLTVQNTGNTSHTFISPSLGVNSVENVPEQKTSTVTFTAPAQVGAYQFWCNIPGHAEAGMVGEVIVQ